MLATLAIMGAIVPTDSGPDVPDYSRLRWAALVGLVPDLAPDLVP